MLEFEPFLNDFIEPPRDGELIYTRRFFWSGEVVQGISSTQFVVAVASGKGGVGKSTVTVNLAAAAAESGLRVGLLDADIYGPSQSRLLGIGDDIKPDVIDEKLLVPLEAHGIKAMSMAFLTNETTPMVWRGPMASGALQQMLELTQWGELDVLFVDMPPGTGDIQLTLTQRAKVSGAVVVTTPQDIALIDARRAIEMFEKVKVPVLGVVQNMATHVCTACGHEDSIFGDQGGIALADEYNASLLANIPLTRRIREDSDGGTPLVISAGDSAEAGAYRQAITAMMEQLRSQSEPAMPTISMGE